MKNFTNEYNEKYSRMGGITLCKELQEVLVTFPKDNIIDALTETAHESVDPYASDLYEKAGFLDEYVEDAVAVFGIPKDHSCLVEHLLRIAEGYYYETTLIDNLESIIYKALIERVEMIKNEDVYQKAIENLDEFCEEISLDDFETLEEIFNALIAKISK